MSTKQLSIIVLAILVGALIVVFGPRFLDGSMSLPRLPDVSGPFVVGEAEIAQKKRDESQQCSDYRLHHLANPFAVLAGKPDESAWIESLRVAGGCTEREKYDRNKR